MQTHLSGNGSVRKVEYINSIGLFAWLFVVVVVLGSFSFDLFVNLLWVGGCFVSVVFETVPQIAPAGPELPL